jgi:hypothetical protein
MLFVDGGGDRVYIGRNETDGIINAKLQVESLTSDAAISVHRASADAAGAGLILSSSRAATLGDDTVVQDDDILGFIEFDGADGTDRNTPGAQIIAKVEGTPGGNDMPTELIFTTTPDGASSPTDRMFISSAGRVSLGTSKNTAKLNIIYNGWQEADPLRMYDSYTGNTTNNTLQMIRNGNQVGSITNTLTAVQFNTSSDYRLKENVDYTWDATTRLKQLKPVRFNFIIDDTNTLVDGFLAHEAATVIPEAVNGTHNETEVINNVVLHADGSVNRDYVTEAEWTQGKIDGDYLANTTWAATKTVPKYQAIDQSKLVPLLAKSLQEAITKIETLETKVQALEDA